MASGTPRPRSAFRRVERWFVGGVLGIAAFFIEKVVMRSIRRGGEGAPPPVEATTMQSRGSTIEG
jgi:hypothetical protein